MDEPRGSVFVVPEDIFELVLVEGDEEHDGDPEGHAKQVEEEANPLPAMLLGSVDKEYKTFKSLS